MKIFGQMTILMDRMNASLPFGLVLALCIRILVAGICGAWVGIERTRRFKGAGIRTHVVVACTAALMMIVSKYGFADLTDAAGNSFAGVRGADSARIAAQVVSGISFLGAGIIFKNRTSIKGLTTAAGVWATAGIGLAIGSGMYFLGIFLTIALELFHNFSHKYAGVDYVTMEMFIIVEDCEEFDQCLKTQLKEWNAQIASSNIEKKNHQMKYQLIINLPKSIELEDTVHFLRENSVVQSFECHFPT